MAVFIIIISAYTFHHENLPVPPDPPPLSANKHAGVWLENHGRGSDPNTDYLPHPRRGGGGLLIDAAAPGCQHLIFTEIIALCFDHCCMFFIVHNYECTL